MSAAATTETSKSGDGSMLLGAPSGAPSSGVAGTASTARMGSIGLGLLRQIFTLAFRAQKMGCPVRDHARRSARAARGATAGLDATMQEPDFRDDVRRKELDAEGPVTGGEVGTVLRDIYATTKTVVQRHDTIRSER